MRPPEGKAGGTSPQSPNARRASASVAGGAAGGVSGTAAASRSAIVVNTAMRAACVSLPSMTCHGAQWVSLWANISRSAAR
jgi:hypothetical protein